jgi:hypothetical protein
MKAREPKPDLSTALTVAAFCQMFCITPELYAALKRTGLGPREVRIGDRTVIPLEYTAMWRVDAEPLRVFAQRWLCR